MGCSLSSKLSSSTTTTTTTTTTISNKSRSSSSSNIIRVVHLNGSLEVYEDPITVGQVTGKQPKHFVFAQADQLLSLESKPLGHHAQLQLGNIYFLLPHSVFQSELSPIDLATISRRLTVVAQAPRHAQCSSSTPLLPAAPAKTTPSRRNYNSPSRTTTSSPNRYADRTTTASPNRFSDRRWRYEGGSDPFYCAGGFNMQNQPPNQSSPCWKPILESIIERSFTHRSESDLQELGTTAKLGIKASL